jgi:hypothetical protein
VFAHQKNRYGLFIRTIRCPAVVCLQTTRGGLARAEAKLILANIAFNMDRLVFHEKRTVAV